MKTPKFIPTPGPVAGLGRAVDRRNAHLNTPAALAVIIGVYLLFFGSGIYSGIAAWVTHARGGVEDYASLRGGLALTQVVTEIVGAGVLLYLVCRWLHIPAALAGVGRRRLERIALGDRRRFASPSWPAMVTVAAAVAGLGIALVVGLVLTLDEPTVTTNSTAADNTISLIAGAARSINAGVVEEIVIVALPVLIGRRAGWHPVAIIGLSILLRWPFHIYHGLWWSLPWAIIWAGTFATTYMYVRRLWPLIIVHACNDLIGFYGDHDTLYAATGITIFAALIGIGVRNFVGDVKRRRTTPGQRPVTYTRLGSGNIALTRKTMKTATAGEAITAIRADQRRDRGVIYIGCRKRHPWTQQLAALGYQRPRITRYRVPLTQPTATPTQELEGSRR